MQFHSNLRRFLPCNKTLRAECPVLISVHDPVLPAISHSRLRPATDRLFCLLYKIACDFLLNDFPDLCFVQSRFLPFLRKTGVITIGPVAIKALSPNVQLVSELPDTILLLVLANVIPLGYPFVVPIQARIVQLVFQPR